ncbi:MAG: Ig-like domain-containing protein, partial [Candidatus Heimdallarchaeota archaeon]
TNHRQYEIRIPLNILQVTPGNITAIGIEAFDDYGDVNFESSITWPGLTSEPGRIWTDPSSWGDLYIGKDTSTSSYYAQYVIEENTNIRSDAIGMNNGTFMTTGDIDGNGDLELIIGSNMTDGTDINLLTIYDYIDSTLTPIWQSWESGHDAKMIKPMGLATHDFDEDGKDEIYICSDDDARILRLFDWNASISDFDNSEYAYVHARNLRGYIAIGDVDNNAADGAEIAIGDREGALGGNMIILGYTIGTDTFTLEKSFTPGITLGSATRRIHAIDIADMDEDGDNELLYACQYSIDDSLSYTALKIEYSGFLGNYFDNPEDDLPANSASATADQFTHSILVADVDNDGNNEIVLVGKNYLKIFGPNTFSGANAPIELIINSTSLPNMGGGVVFGDIDLDGAGELIVGASNGTLYFLNITDSGSDNLSYTIEWQSDIGDSPGKQESMVIYDLDNDSENELFVGDNYGQIMSIGKGQAPTVSITSPSFGQTKKDVAVEFTWEAIDDYSMHHFNVYVNGSFVARTGGAQTGIILELAQGENDIIVNGFDVTGLNDSAYTEVFVNLNSPEVTILNPEDDFSTNGNFINLVLSVDDINDDFDQYNFYINGTPSGSTTNDFYPLTLPSVNGILNITVVAIDLASNIGRDTVFIIRDIIEPNIVITSPFDGASVKNSEITVQWTANDLLSGIDYYQIWLDGSFVTNVFSANSYLVPLGIDDEYAITVIAFDKAGNSNDDTNIVTKDTVNPTVEITSHVDGFITSLTSINLVWDSEDNYGREIHHTEVTVNDNPRYSGGLEEATINLENNKINEVLVTTYDLAGNIGQDAISIIVDNSNPFIEILAPVNNYNTSMDSVTVYWNSSDTGSGISYYVILVDSTPYTTIYDPFVTSHTIDLPTDKSYTIVVRAFDYSGHQFADSIIVTRNSSMEEIAITSPSPTYCYITTTTVTMDWLVANIVNVTMFEIYINGQLNFTINDNTTRTYLIDFGAIPIDQYPTYNITIVAYTTTPLEMYSDMIWLMIDQSAPYLFITNPVNNSDISDNLIYLQWDSHDDGSGLERYTIKVDGIVVSSGVGEIDSLYLLLNDSFGTVIITIEVWDIATNTAQSVLSLNVYLTLPVATINLQNPFYTNTNELNFDLSIINAQTGVSSIFVYTKETDAGITPPDLRDVFDYTADIQYNPFLLPITIDLPVTEGEYLLTVSIIDSFGHEELIECIFYIDLELPGISLTTINDQSLSNGGSEQSEVEIAKTATSFTVFAYVNDDLGLHTVQVRINGTDKDETYYDVTYFMSPNNVSTSTLGVYSATINLTDIPFGDYIIEITVTDLAGNSIKHSYAINLAKESGLPPFLQGNNLIYLSVGIAVFLILIVLMSVVVRKRVANLGWKNEIITAAYILNGLPCVYMMNKP